MSGAEPLALQELHQSCYQKIKKGSKSFFFASLFLSPLTRKRAWLLYAWCRVSDDLIDQAPSKKVALQNIESLKSNLAQVYNSNDLNPRTLTEIDQGILILKNQVGLSQVYLQDLLRGYQMDLEGYVAKPTDTLLDYCYCVAGTVGLLMCQVMGITHAKALEHAKNLGIAMQLTNIMRDIKSDLELGRIYLPEEFFLKSNLSPQELDSNFKHIAQLGARYLFELAESYYASGKQGFKYLPWRERTAIAVATATYRQIGIEVMKRGPEAWTSRTYTSPWKKLKCAMLGIYWALTSK